MRILVVLILLAFGLVTEGKTQSKDSATLRLCDSASYYESQIRKADSLYKNYLPQYNFEEVKAAVEFFDSLKLSMDNGDGSGYGNGYGDGNGYGNNIPLPTPTSDSASASASAIRLQHPIFLCAKAHYYHAVGLTEKDDIVGACEHYLIALEIMEDMMAKDKSLRKKDKRLKAKVDNPEEYEKIRFIALIYTRLGELFYNENYCNLAIIKYRKALKYDLLLKQTSFVANTYKCLGNSYQLANKLDSALYYYNESLKCNSNLPNKLDVEKSIVQILFYKGERDSAYRLINNNLDKLEGYAAKYSYYQILGEMYHSDNLYDSAIKYLNLSMCATNKHTILATSNILTTIYDSIGNMDLKFFYDSISLSILNSNHNKSIHTAKLQNVYSEYANRKQVREIEKQKIESRKHFVKYLITALFFTIVLVCIIFVLRYRYRKDKVFYDEKIFNMNSEISEKNVEIENSNQKISEINSELENLTKKYDKLSNDYISNKKELEKTLSRKVTKNDIKNFCNCENSKKILANIDNIKNSNLKINNLAALTNKELRQLLDDADICLYDFTAVITNKYPKLNDEDLYCICLLLLNIKGPTIAALLGKEYNSVWSRIKKIYSIIGINSKENLHKIFY